jgi:tetratricopeptide (TPR) repeat protein
LCRFSQVIWIDASNGETLTQDLKNIGELDAGAAPPVLFIFDNADGEPGIVKKFLPRTGYVLLTSRKPEMGQLVPAGACDEIGSLELGDAVSLLLGVAGKERSPGNQKLAEGIVEALFCLPLAVEQAGSAIRKNLCDIGKYLETFSKHRVRLMSNPHLRLGGAYEHTLYGALDLSLKEMQKTATDPRQTEVTDRAMFVLFVFAFLHHNNIVKDIFKYAAINPGWPSYDAFEDPYGEMTPPILEPTPLLETDSGGEWNPFSLGDCIMELTERSLVKEAADQRSYSVHPMVQFWLRDTLPKDEQIRACNFANALLINSIIPQCTLEEPEFCSALLPHIRANNDRKAELQEGPVGGYNDAEFFHYGLVYNEMGYWEEAKEMMCKVVQARRRILGEEHPETLASLGSLALTYNLSGDLANAETLEFYVFQICLKRYGERSRDTLISMDYLARIYTNQDKWTEAEEFQLKIITIRKELCAERGLDVKDDHDLLIAILNLTVTYQNQERWKEAEKLQLEVLEISKEASETLVMEAKASLAVTYRHMERWEEAKSLDLEVIQESERMGTSEHPDTLSSMENLAQTYADMGNGEEMEKMGRKVLQMRKRVHGPAHGRTLETMDLLADMYEEMGQEGKADGLRREIEHLRG